MIAAERPSLLAGAVSLVMLFTVAVALHARLYETRPEPARLTQFYLVMSAGGALGGLFTALIAPLVFDWSWEHPLLILAAAALLPLGVWSRLLGRRSRTRTDRCPTAGGSATPNRSLRSRDARRRGPVPCRGGGDR